LGVGRTEARERIYDFEIRLEMTFDRFVAKTGLRLQPLAQTLVREMAIEP
jgi:hypothetical protein